MPHVVLRWQQGRLLDAPGLEVMISGHCSADISVHTAAMPHCHHCQQPPLVPHVSDSLSQACLSLSNPPPPSCPPRFQAKLLQLHGQLALVEYAELAANDEGSEKLREWFLMPALPQALEALPALEGGYAVHNDPRFRLRPAMPPRVKNQVGGRAGGCCWWLMWLGALGGCCRGRAMRELHKQLPALACTAMPDTPRLQCPALAQAHAMPACLAGEGHQRGAACGRAAGRWLVGDLRGLRHWRGPQAAAHCQGEPVGGRGRRGAMSQCLLLLLLLLLLAHCAMQQVHGSCRSRGTCRSCCMTCCRSQAQQGVVVCTHMMSSLRHCCTARAIPPCTTSRVCSLKSPCTPGLPCQVGPEEIVANAKQLRPSAAWDPITDSWSLLAAAGVAQGAAQQEAAPAASAAAAAPAPDPAAAAPAAGPSASKAPKPSPRKPPRQPKAASQATPSQPGPSQAGSQQQSGGAPTSSAQRAGRLGRRPSYTDLLDSDDGDSKEPLSPPSKRRRQASSSKGTAKRRRSAGGDGDSSGSDFRAEVEGDSSETIDDEDLASEHSDGAAAADEGLEDVLPEPKKGALPGRGGGAEHRVCWPGHITHGRLRL